MEHHGKINQLMMKVVIQLRYIVQVVVLLIAIGLWERIIQIEQQEIGMVHHGKQKVICPYRSMQVQVMVQNE